MEAPFTCNFFAGTATPAGTDSEQKAFEDNKFCTKQILPEDTRIGISTPQSAQ